MAGPAMDTVGWPAAAPATGAELSWGVDAAGNPAAIPLHAMRGHGLYNWNPSLVPKARKAFANVRAGISDMKLACPGDSTTAGVSFTLQPKSQSWPTLLASLLTARGVPARSDSFFGNQNFAAASQVTYDPRLSLATFSSANTNSSNTTLGGLGVSPSTTDTNPMVFTPTGTFDTFDVYFTVAGGGGAQAVVSVDSGAALTANGDSNAYVDTSVGTANAIIKKTYSVALGTHAIKIARNGTGLYLTVNFVECYTSTAAAVRVQNMGWPSSKSSDWAATGRGTNPINALPIVAPDLSIINLGINDAPAVSPATFTTNMQGLITAAKSTGDVILLVPFPSSPSNAGAASPTANQVAIQAAIYALAVTNACPVIDMRARFTDWATASANGFAQGTAGTDGLHPNQLGKADMASYLLGSVLRLLEG